MFESISAAPADAILGLTEKFKSDPNPQKINLGVGVYKDAGGSTPILSTVKQAESRLLESQNSKTYLPIHGDPAYALMAQKLLFGDDHEICRSGRAVTVQTPGGTGALRVAAEFIAKTLPSTRVWLSRPTWPNHPHVFGSAGLEVADYPYYDAGTHGLDFENMLAVLHQMSTDDVLLLHGCCHNPTGVDLTLEQWVQVADVVFDRGLLPVVDFAYQGYARGLREDTAGFLQLCRPGVELMICSSFSKNFGLYNERVGALTVVASDADAAQVALSHVKRCVRATYSNPPAHGSAIVATVLGDDALRTAWETEVTEMRERINNMRHLFVETLSEKGVARDFSFITKQRGMFSYSGLNERDVAALRDRYSIYIVNSGRISVAGMTEENMDYLCSAIAAVLQEG